MNLGDGPAGEVVAILAGTTPGLNPRGAAHLARAAEGFLVNWLGIDSPEAALARSVRSGSASQQEQAHLRTLLRQRARESYEFQAALTSVVQQSQNLMKAAPIGADHAAAGIDIPALVARLGHRKNDYLAEVQSRVETDLRAMTATRAWSVIVTDATGASRTLKPPPGPAYVAALTMMLRDRPGNPARAESGATEVVLEAVQQATASFYREPVTEQEIGDELARQFAEQAAASRVVGTEAEKMLRMLVREVGNVAVDAPVKAAAIDRVGVLFAAFLTGASAHMILGVLGKVMATHVGQLVATSAAIGTAKAVSLTAVKGAVMTAVAHIGIVPLLKTTVGHSIIVCLAEILKIHMTPRKMDMVEVGVLVVVLPVVMRREGRKLPEKLSAKLPPQVVEILSGSYEEVNSSAMRQLVGPLLETLIWEFFGGRLDWTRPISGGA